MNFNSGSRARKGVDYSVGHARNAGA